MYKLVVFIPIENAEDFKENLFKAGAGKLGDYSHCCFQTEGVGQFRPLAGSNPTIGQYNKIEKVSEVRIETIVDKNCIEEVIAELYKSHPYEEPAFDLIELQNNKYSHLKNNLNY